MITLAHNYSGLNHLLKFTAMKIWTLIALCFLIQHNLSSQVTFQSLDDAYRLLETQHSKVKLAAAQSEELINEIINMKLYQKAFEFEAEKRGITVLNEEITGIIEEQVDNFEEMLMYDDDMRKMYEELFEEQNISSVEEYFWDIQYDNIKASILIDKLYLEFEIEREMDIHYYEDFFLVIQENFMEENKDKIKRLRRKYGLLDVEQPENF